VASASVRVVFSVYVLAGAAGAAAGGVPTRDELRARAAALSVDDWSRALGRQVLATPTLLRAGCTAAAAPNFNPGANYDDGSCAPPSPAASAGGGERERGGGSAGDSTRVAAPGPPDPPAAGRAAASSAPSAAAAAGWAAAVVCLASLGCGSYWLAQRRRQQALAARKAGRAGAQIDTLRLGRRAAAPPPLETVRVVACARAAQTLSGSATLPPPPPRARAAPTSADAGRAPPAADDASPAAPPARRALDGAAAARRRRRLESLSVSAPASEPEHALPLPNALGVAGARREPRTASVRIANAGPGASERRARRLAAEEHDGTVPSARAPAPQRLDQDGPGLTRQPAAVPGQQWDPALPARAAEPALRSASERRARRLAAQPLVDDDEPRSVVAYA
jgi:hypothetical protein